MWKFSHVCFLLVWWCTLLILCQFTHGYPTGPPVTTNPEICTDLTPQQHTAPPQTGTSPFSIIASELDELRYVVAVMGFTFRGFMVIAHELGKVMPIGTFTNPSAFTQVLTCFGDGSDAWGHIDDNGETIERVDSLAFWSPPPDFTGTVVFSATVVQTISVYWVGLQSSELSINIADIDTCDANPCENGGVCTDEFNGYTCSCQPGWDGDTCGNNIDECNSIPCENGGICTDDVNGYTCDCMAGWNGVTCGNDVNPRCSIMPQYFYEDASSNILIVERIGDLSSGGSCKVRTSDGTATVSGEDFMALDDFPVFFNAEQASVGILIQIVSDFQCEVEEYFWIQVTENDGVIVDPTEEATEMLIVDSECLACIALHPPTNGIINEDGDIFFVGDVQTITCNSGFRVNGPADFTCTAIDENSAEWQPSPDTTMCEQSCTTIVEPPNGALDPAGANPIDHGATLTITCDPGYTHVGDTVTTCSSGTLTPDISETTCEQSCTTINESPNHWPNGALDPSTSNPIAHGATLTISCDPGYTPVGDTVTTCSSGTLIPDISETTCDSILEQSCTTIVEPPNGALDPLWANPIDHGATLTITCDPGYTPVGDTITTCSSGTLTPDISETTCVLMYVICPADTTSAFASVNWPSLDIIGFPDTEDVSVSYMTNDAMPLNVASLSDGHFGAQFEAGTTHVIATASDTTGNSASCEFLVTFLDEEPPVLTCSPSLPEKIMVETSPVGSNFAFVDWETPRVSDNSGETPSAWTVGFSSGHQYPIGSYEVLYRATDSSGNTGYCVVAFEVIDREPPRLICPEDILTYTDPSLPTSTVVWSTIDVQDNSGEDIISVSTPADISSGYPFPIGITQLVLTATDSSDNQASCSFTVTVIDKEPPRMSCESLTVPTDPGKATANIFWADPEVNDNSGEVITTFPQGPTSGTRFSVGPSAIITYTAVDSSGNEGFCVFSVRVIDEEPPTIQCPVDQTKDTANGASHAAIFWEEPSVRDNVDFSLTAISDIESGDRFQLGPTVVTYSTVDGAGNVGTCSFTVFISDAESPILVCPANVTVEVEPDVISSPVWWTGATAEDNSGQSLVPVPDVVSGSVFQIGTTRVTYLATDPAGNIGQCSFLVIVNTVALPDPTPPVINIQPDEEFYIAEELEGMQYYYTGITTAFDAQGRDVFISYSPASGCYFPVGTTVVLVTATIYYESPISTPSQSRASINNGAPISTSSQFTVQAKRKLCPPNHRYRSSRCSTVESGQFLNTAYPGIISNIMYKHNPTLATTEASSTISTYYVKIIDGKTTIQGCYCIKVIVPNGCTRRRRQAQSADDLYLTCPEDQQLSIQPDQLGICFDYPEAVVCPSNLYNYTSVSYSVPSGYFFPLGTTSVTVSASGQNNDITSCQINVDVSIDNAVDILPPSITCPDDLEVSAERSESGVELIYPAPLVSDNSGSVAVSYSHDSGSFFNIGETVVLIRTMDRRGNYNQCMFRVNVFEPDPDTSTPMSTTPELTTTPSSTSSITTSPLQCEEGFQVVDDSCVDINECLQPQQCPAVARCVNTEGAYMCRCTDGYELVTPFPNIVCVDIDECDNSIAACDVNSICINIPGGYQCVCSSLNEPLIDPGSSCPRMNPCDSSPCRYGGTCNNDDAQIVGYQCTCEQDRTGPNCDLPALSDDAITIVTEPVEVVTQIFRSVTLECRFDNAEQIKWYYDEIELTANRDQEVLYIPTITAFDQGYYYCVAANSRGETIETKMAPVRIEDVSIYPTTAVFVPLVYTEDLQNPQTDYFLEVSSEIIAFLEPRLQNFATLENPPMVHIKKLASGSVVAQLNVYTPKSTNDEDTLNNLQHAFDSIAINSDGLLTQDRLLVQSAATCRNITCNTEHGPIFFRATPVKQMAYSNSSCLCDTGPVASLICDGDLLSAATWTCDDVVMLCEQGTVEEQLLELSLECDISEETSLQVVERINELSLITNDIRDSGVTSIATILQKVADVQPRDPAVMNNVIEILSNVMNVKDSMLNTAQADSGSTNQLIMSLENLLQTVRLNTDGVFSFTSENIGLDIIEVEETDVVNGLTFISMNKSSINYGIEDGMRIFDESFASSLFLPQSLTRLIFEGASTQRIAFTVYQDASLFISPSLVTQNENKPAFERAINTQVISCSIGDRRYTNLPDPVVTSYTLKETGDYVNGSSCVYWDFMGDNGKGNWSSEGCTLVDVVGTRYRECECNHLTNFAVLVNIYGPRSVSPTQAFVLELLSYIGCGLSILGIIIIFIAYIPNRNLRSKLPNKILLRMCASLLFLYVFSIVIIVLDSETDVEEVTIIPCSILAGILQFSLLSVLAWTVVEGINMYLLFVKVFNTYVEKFMLKASLFAYGVPGVIVGVTAALSRERYAQTDLCFLQSQPLIYGVMVPMAIVIIVNIFVFVIVLTRLTKSAPGKVTSVKRKKQLKSQLKNAVMFLLLLGLTWSVGYLAVIKAVSFLAQLFFCVLNSMLGYFLFVVYVIRPPGVRKQFTSYCKATLFDRLKSERLVSTSGGGTTSQIPTSNRGIHRQGSATGRSNGNGIGRRAASFNQGSVPLTSVERNRIDEEDEE